jgi:hypothetical protein
VGDGMENLKEKAHSEDLSIDGRIILKRILTNYCGKDVEWNLLVQNMDRWLAHVNT